LLRAHASIRHQRPYSPRDTLQEEEKHVQSGHDELDWAFLYGRLLDCIGIKHHPLVILTLTLALTLTLI
jgi:hypothetical protein